MLALVVEDGSLVADANSYIDLAFADQYIYDYFPEDENWQTLSDEMKTLYIIRATKFLDSLLRWSGELVDITQSLAFPRANLTDREGREISESEIPAIIKEVVASFAMEAAKGTLEDNPEYIVQETFGATSNTFTKALRTGGNRIIFDFKRQLMTLGYGRNNSSIIILERA